MLGNPILSGNHAQKPVLYRVFRWRGTEFKALHPALVDDISFERVKRVFSGHNKPKYRKHDFAFAGLLRGAHDGFTVTTELRKGKYIYYRCSQCAKHYMREPDVSDKLGDVLRGIYVPETVVSGTVESLQAGRAHSEAQRQEQLSATKRRLATLRARMDQMYEDTLDGKIDEEFWTRKMNEWREQEPQLQGMLERLNLPQSPEHALSAQRILELANKAYSLYLRGITRKARCPGSLGRGGFSVHGVGGFRILGPAGNGMLIRTARRSCRGAKVPLSWIRPSNRQYT